jgi:hypothetical protein
MAACAVVGSGFFAMSIGTIVVQSIQEKDIQSKGENHGAG